MVERKIKIKLAAIFVSGVEQIETKTFLNAFDLCKSVTEIPILIWSSSNIIPNFVQDLIIQKKLKLEKQTPESPNSFLDKFSLDYPILLVTVGSSHILHTYCHERLLKEEKVELRWNILASDYARYSLLDKQKSLSDYIPTDTALWVKNLIFEFGEDYMLEVLNEISNSEAILIGESIIDEYIICEALGKVSKDPLVAFSKKDRILQSGGVLAASKHFAGFGCKTHVVSEVGKEEAIFVRKDLESYKNLSYDLQTDFSSIIKTRYVDRSSNARVFETYSLPQNYNNDKFKDKIRELLESKEKIENLVIMDYGHDLFDRDVIEIILNSQHNLSINTQSNAGNRGFNTISKYKGAKNIFLNGSEVQLEIRDKHSDLLEIVPALAIDNQFEEIYVTNGAKGIICWSSMEGLFIAPAFAPTIVDRTGAGDATLAIISALRARKINRKIAAFYGNIAGALLVSSLGNETTLTKNLLQDEASSILKRVKNI